MSASADLTTLEASGLIQVASLEPELEYLFRHALVQDAAYGSLLRQDRRALHRRAAEALLDLYPDRVRELAGVIAMHLEEAGDDPTEYLVMAGEHALERFANREATAFFERAVALIPAGDAPRAGLRLRAALGATKAGWTFGPFGAGIARLEEAARADAGIDQRLLADAYFWIAFLRRFQGETPDSSPALASALERLAAIGESIGDPRARAIPQAFMGMGMAFTGQLRAGAELIERSLAAMEDGGDEISAAILSDVLSVTYARLGEFPNAERSLERATRLADKGDAIARLDAMIARSAIAIERGELREGEQLASQCALQSDELGALACSVGSNVLAGYARLSLDEARSAEQPLERGREFAAVANVLPMANLARGLLGSVKGRLGDLPGALAGWDGSLESVRRMHDRQQEGTILWHRARTHARDALPDWAAVLIDLDAASALFEAIGARPALARVLRDRGQALRALGRAADADASERRSRELAHALGLRDFA